MKSTYAMLVFVVAVIVITLMATFKGSPNTDTNEIVLRARVDSLSLVVDSLKSRDSLTNRVLNMTAEALFKYPK